MKFTIAASILAQTIPVISEKASSKLLTQTEQPELLSQFITTIAKRRSEGKTALSGSFAGARLSGAALGILKDCDPSSEDPDVGILSCAVGYECVSDDASGLGGVCMSTSRELQENPCLVCPNGALDEESYTQVLEILDVPIPVTCGFMAAFLYVNVTSTSEDCIYISPLLQASGCCEGGAYFQCDICDGGELKGDESVTLGNYTYTCLEAATFATEPFCSTYKAQFAPVCCGEVSMNPPNATVDDPTSVGPSAVPGETTPPPSGSAGMWSTSTIVSMMGLAVATVGAFVMN
jgi:hypothetical protein